MKSKLLRLFSSLSLIIFFFPLFTVSCSNQKTSINGINLAFGKEIMNQHANGNLFMILLFILPLIVLIIGITQLVEYENIAGVLSGIISLILLILANTSIQHKAEESYASVNLELGYYLMFLLNMAVLGVIIHDLIKKNASPPILTSKISNKNDNGNP